MKGNESEGSGKREKLMRRNIRKDKGIRNFYQDMKSVIKARMQSHQEERIGRQKEYFEEVLNKKKYEGRRSVTFGRSSREWYIYKTVQIYQKIELDKFMYKYGKKKKFQKV